MFNFSLVAANAESNELRRINGRWVHLIPFLPRSLGALEECVPFLLSNRSRAAAQLETFAKKGDGFAFFPEIKKGGLIVGGAGGRGVVYEKGQYIGYADLTQVSVGFQAGGQTYSELIVFQDQAAMNRFKQNETNFGANASAVLAENGAAADAQFVDGVAVFIKPITGAMAEASLGGQQITYMPK